MELCDNLLVICLYIRLTFYLNKPINEHISNIIHIQKHIHMQIILDKLICIKTSKTGVDLSSWESSLY